MQARFNVHLILARIKRAAGVKSDVALCEVLGISSGGLSDLKRRNRLPWRAIIEYCHEKNLSLDDLVFGPEQQPRRSIDIKKISEAA